jgi:hypothetical protein
MLLMPLCEDYIFIHKWEKRRFYTGVKRDNNRQVQSSYNFMANDRQTVAFIRGVQL